MVGSLGGPNKNQITYTQSFRSTRGFVSGPVCKIGYIYIYIYIYILPQTSIIYYCECELAKVMILKTEKFSYVNKFIIPKLINTLLLMRISQNDPNKNGQYLCIDIKVIPKLFNTLLWIRTIQSDPNYNWPRQDEIKAPSPP